MGLDLLSFANRMKTGRGFYRAYDRLWLDGITYWDVLAATWKGWLTVSYASNGLGHRARMIGLSDAACDTLEGFGLWYSTFQAKWVAR